MFKLVVKGGLGNQLFQVSAVYALSRERNLPFVLDLSFMNNRLPIPGFTYRKYLLKEYFDVDLRIETTLLNYLPLYQRYFAYPLLKLSFLLGKDNVYIEKHPYSYDKGFFNIHPDTYIEGYFNNYKYFYKYSKDIKDFFNVKNIKCHTPLMEEITNRDSVFIHIRRGDYLNNKHKDVFEYLDSNYYNKAILEVKKRVKKPYFYVFSYDDPNWPSENLNLSKSEYTIVPTKLSGQDIFKVYFKLMSLCKHGILSNSTFAWWSSFLSPYEESSKIVVSPKMWMKQYEFQNPDIWITI